MWRFPLHGRPTEGVFELLLFDIINQILFWLTNALPRLFLPFKLALLPSEVSFLLPKITPKIFNKGLLISNSLTFLVWAPIVSLFLVFFCCEFPERQTCIGVNKPRETGFGAFGSFALLALVRWCFLSRESAASVLHVLLFLSHVFSPVFASWTGQGLRFLSCGWASYWPFSFWTFTCCLCWLLCPLFLSTLVR